VEGEARGMGQARVAAEVLAGEQNPALAQWGIAFVQSVVSKSPMWPVSAA